MGSLEDNLETCLWKKCLEFEKNNFSADNSAYPIITKKEDSKLYKTCNGCDGKKMECKDYVSVP